MLYKKDNLEDWLNDRADEMEADSDGLKEQCYALAGWLIKYGDNYTPNVDTLLAARCSADQVRTIVFNVNDYFNDDPVLLSDGLDYVLTLRQ